MSCFRDSLRTATLIFSLWFGAGQGLLWAAQAPVRAEIESAEDFAAMLMRYADSGELQQARDAIRGRPAESESALRTLISQFDSSVHSFRDKPEQRRVQYSEPVLDLGLKLAGIAAEVTGDDSFQRRFQARKDRIAATKMLNDKQFKPAMDLITSVRATALALEDKSFLFSTYLTSAYAHFGLGSADQALADCEVGLKLARETGDPSKEALALFNLGTAYMHMNRTAESLPYSRQAAEAAAKVGNKLWEANAWLNIGSAEMLLRNFEPAEKALVETLRLSKEVGDKLAEGRALFDLGALYHSWGRWQSAASNLEESLKFIRTVDIRHSHDINAYNQVERDALELLVDSYRKLNRKDGAVTEAQARLDELKAMPRPDEHGHTH